jgi:predicted permease
MILTEAWQSWRRARGVALLAVIAFAVGIGSTTAIYTVINGVLLRPLPYPESDRFVVLFGGQTNEPERFTAHTSLDVVEYEQRTSSFDVFGWFRLGGFNLTAPGEPQFLTGAAVTTSLAHKLGVRPALGQWFIDDTGAVISNRLWKRLGGDPNIIGTPITVDGRRLTITGVMPPTFRLPTAGTVPLTSDAEIWTYLGPSGQRSMDSILFAYARRKPGVSFGQAEADVKRVAANIASLSPASHPSYTARLIPLRDAPFLELRSTLLVLFIAAGLLLLIACANVATLLLARSVARIRDTAIRVALGAPRRHLAARYFVEALVVSVAGAVAGAALSVVLVRAISIGGSELIQADEIGIDWKVLGVGTLLTFVATALASAAPLWQAVRTAPGALLADGVRASASMHVRRLSRVFVVGEIALAFVLLAISTILVVHLQRLTRVSPGFNPDDLLTFEIGVPRAVFDSRDRRPYQKRMVDALAEVPGVGHVAFANQLPLDGCCFGGTLYPEGQPPTSDARRVSFMSVMPGYFTTMGIPLRAGRLLTERDTSQDMAFGVINEAAARRYWPDRNPVGSYARISRPDGERVQILGVVGDVRNDGLKKPTEAELYLLTAIIPVSPMRFVVRSALSPARVISDVRRAVQRVDPTVVVHDVKTMNAVIHDSLQLERISSFVMTFFALTALLMATLGIYGVVSHSVQQRTVELGTRMALGALDRDILRLVVGGAVKMAALGVAVGGVAAMGGVWLLVRFLDVRDIGAPPFVFSTITVAAIAVAASYLPAWRATFLSPMAAIRDDAASSAWQTMRLQMRRAVQEVAQRASPGDSRQLSPTALLTQFVAAARAADSAADALRASVATLCDRLGVERALLLERKSDQDFQCSVAIGLAGSTPISVPARGFLVKRLEAYPHPLSFTHADLDALARWAEGYRPDRLAEIQWLRDVGVRTAVPLRTKAEILGILLLGPAGDRDQLAPAEKEALPACADQFALMMENARLTDRVVEQEKVRRDLALAAEVQKRLLPTEVPTTSIAEFVGVSVPARSIGGDYYDFIPVGDQQIGIALADVSGKGVAAALIMAAVQASLRVLSSEGNISLPRLAARLNQFLYQSTPANKYATFFYAQLDAERRELRYVNAGHNPPYLVRASQSQGSDDAAALEIHELSAGGAVVGMFPTLSYEEASINLRSGDLLVAFTDGVTEAQNPREEEFGEERLKALVRRLASLPASEISARISSELKEWISDAPQYDDLTFVVMKVN